MRKSLVWFIPLILICCKRDDANGVTTTTPTDTDTTVYSAPTYADDYSSISSWSDRSEWNLANVHDPTVEKSGDYYYMYSTDASYGNAHDGHGHFLYRRSKDLVNWEFRGMAMSAAPAWIKDTVNNMRARLGLTAISDPVLGFWAPVVRKVGSKYRMYYSVVVDNYIQSGLANTTANFDGSWTEHAFIGMMETDYPANNLWTDKGMVMCSVSDKGTDWTRSSLNDYNAYFKYNAIDPSYIITPSGEHWLIYGSWHSGIMALQLDATTGLPLTKVDVNDSNTWGTQIATRTTGSRWQASEGPEVVYNAETGYYYLFTAYDELSIAYNTRVARSKSITGPYEDFRLITHPYKFNDHSGWVGFSHCGIFQDGNDWYYTSQARLPANTNGNPYSNAIMMGHVRHMRWTADGWPVVMPERYAAVPQDTIAEADLVGTWQHISLHYQYQVQNTAQALTLNADHSVTGALTGTWSYDATNKRLTIGSVTVEVERGLDWEASPRKTTIVYAGSAVWGKKN